MNHYNVPVVDESVPTLATEPGTGASVIQSPAVNSPAYVAFDCRWLSCSWRTRGLEQKARISDKR